MYVCFDHIKRKQRFNIGDFPEGIPSSNVFGDVSYLSLRPGLFELTPLNLERHAPIYFSYC